VAGLSRGLATAEIHAADAETAWTWGTSWGTESPANVPKG